MGWNIAAARKDDAALDLGQYDRVLNAFFGRIQRVGQVQQENISPHIVAMTYFNTQLPVPAPNATVAIVLGNTAAVLQTLECNSCCNF